jgi:hypothetical protein
VGLLLHDIAVKLASGGCSAATVAALLEFVVRLALLDAQQLLELLGSMQLQRPGEGDLGVTDAAWYEYCHAGCSQVQEALGVQRHDIGTERALLAEGVAGHAKNCAAPASGCVCTAVARRGRL